MKLKTYISLVIALMVLVLGGLLFVFFQQIFDYFLEQQQEETTSMITSQIRAKVEREKDHLLREIETIGQQELFLKNISVLLSPLLAETSASKMMAYHQLDFFLPFLIDTLFLDFIAILDQREEFVFGYNKLSRSLFPLEDWDKDSEVRLVRYGDALIIIGRMESKVFSDQVITITSGFLLDNTFLRTLTGEDHIPLFLLDHNGILLSSHQSTPPVEVFFAEEITWESDGRRYRGKLRPFLPGQEDLLLGMLFDIEPFLLSRLRIQRGLLLILFFFLVFSLLFGRLLSRSILSPIHHLIKGISRVAKGNYQSTLSLLSPITEIRTLGDQYNHMLQRLNHNRQYIQNLSDSLPLGLLTYDEKGKIRYVNDYFLQLFQGGEDFLGSFIESWSYGLYFTKNQGKQDWSLQIDHRSFLVSSFSFATEQGPQHLHVLRDVTRELLYQEQLMEHERQTAIGKVTAALAHEINNPLGVIDSYVELMEDQEYIPEIRFELKRISRLMKDMMAMVRGKTELERGLVLLDDWLTGWEDMLYWQANQKGISLDLLKEYEREVALSFDADKMRQALLNLFLNSLDACEEGRSIVISIKLLEDLFYIEVKDNGKGIDKEIFPYIFEPFVSSKPPSKGTGLGLSIVQTVAELHGGKVEGWSAEGWTVFLLKIPREGLAEELISIE